MQETKKQNYIKAGKISAQARDYGKKLVKVDASILDIVEKIEEKIIQLGAKPAFPVQFAINSEAAHYTPLPEDKSVFKSGDIVKLDLGAHIEGAIGDTAVTINLGDKNKELVKASEQALKNALQIIKTGVIISDIGKEIEKTITSYGFKPIKNLTGHSIEPYETHAGIAIPNFDDGSQEKLEKSEVIAIEPFATDGAGYIKEGTDSGIYKLVYPKNIRDNYSREILAYIVDEYKTLPFAKRWIVKKFGNVKASFAIRTLKLNGVIQEYAHLPEINNGLVSQSEHTLIIDEKPIITTKDD